MSPYTLHQVSPAPKSPTDELSLASTEMRRTLGAIAEVIGKMPTSRVRGAPLDAVGLLFAEASIHVQALAELMCEATVTLDV